jgi:hypothetical protein
MNSPPGFLSATSTHNTAQSKTEPYHSTVSQEKKPDRGRSSATSTMLRESGCVFVSENVCVFFMRVGNMNFHENLHSRRKLFS